MKLLEYKETIDKVASWNATLLEEALHKKDVLSQVQSYVLSEICKPSSQKGKIPFEEILTQKSLEDFMKSSPSLCIEFLFLLKKYDLDLYEKEAVSIIVAYEAILGEIWDEQPDHVEVFFMINMLHQLTGTSPEFKKIPDIMVSEDSFLLKPKTVIEKHLNDLILSSHCGLHHIQLTPATIEAIETVLLDFAAKYDLILASKALKILRYAGVKHSYSNELAYNFLMHNQSIEGYIGHYDPEFIKTKTEHIAQSQRLQITKEIVISLLEYTTHYRHVRDFSKDTTPQPLS